MLVEMCVMSVLVGFGYAMAKFVDMVFTKN